VGEQKLFELASNIEIPVTKAQLAGFGKGQRLPSHNEPSPLPPGGEVVASSGVLAERLVPDQEMADAVVEALRADPEVLFGVLLKLWESSPKVAGPWGLRQCNDLPRGLFPFNSRGCERMRLVGWFAS